MGYMFNKQFRGYNTEEVDETIASLEKNIQDRSLQIRRLEEELEKIGVNNSIIHVDFMIGTSDLEVTGINENGETIQIFSNGNWAF